MIEHVAVLWTGGKDCALAMHEACEGGCDVRALITFAPADAHFLAHPLNVIRLQAETLGRPHYCIEVSEPYEDGYRRAIGQVRDRLGIATLITGDIGPVDGHGNWIRQCAEPLGLEVHTPLWDADREALLNRLIEAGFVAIISCVQLEWLGEEWLGTELTADVLERLVLHSRKSGIDPCGEQGEYHTLVMDGPGFRHRVTPGPWRVGRSGGLAYLEWA